MTKYEKPPWTYVLKRRIAKLTAEESNQLAARAGRVRYGGNPKHKKDPGDFGLIPPAAHNGQDPERGNDALCDVSHVRTREEAQRLLEEAFRSGFVDARRDGVWPKVVWVVADGHVFEARLENRGQGTYHGYPLPYRDPMRAVVLKALKDRGDG
jgi:hypothetical protein